ncbi:MAG: zinc-dependent alcohol dehydrogenase [Planctomycetota bacterium]|jgi:polar amino acid transport system substrate-binding protein
MKQLTQQLKSGDIAIRELPWPQVGSGTLLVRNHYSLISAGTEGSTVKTARKSLVGKAKERPQQVRQVLDTFKKQGPVQTYRAIMKKLDSYSPLGYSSAGEVIEVGSCIDDISVGNRVACAGVGYASHAEIVCVPRNLCVVLADDADLGKACYNTLGAIALQGVRQADLRLGESCAVIGLGLLGQLTCLMLRASGIRTFGIDIDRDAVDVASKHCCDRAWIRQSPGLSSKVNDQTGGFGVDAVIITAGTSSLDPINCAGELARKRGRVVVVGAVPTGFDREPYWYKKELELRMSCSYGPGRYDSAYEEKGLDYPAAYVRWTENRNMQAFQELVHNGRIDPGYLTTHEFELEHAPQAYDMIVNRSEPFLGVVLKYDVQRPIERWRIAIGPAKAEGRVNIAFIGAGSYAQQNLLPNIPGDDSDVTCVGVMTNSGTTSKRAAEKFGFQFCTSEPADIFENDAVNTVRSQHSVYHDAARQPCAIRQICPRSRKTCVCGKTALPDRGRAE